MRSRGLASGSSSSLEGVLGASCLYDKLLNDDYVVGEFGSIDLVF